MKVAIAVVSWNTRELLRCCLESLAQEAERGVAEVWVVDNGSVDGSAEMVRDRFEWVSLLEMEENLGFGPAVNEVAARTQAEWIAPANADISLPPGTLEALLATGSDPAVGVVSPRLLMDDGRTQHSVHAFPTISLAALFALGAYRLPGLGDRLCIEGFWRPEIPRDIDWAHGAFLLVRRSAFDQIGGFDPDQWMYAEDIDLHWRLRRGGWRARYEPAATVRHAVSAAAVQAFGDERTARHLAASYAWQARRQGLHVAWICAGLNALGAAARWVGFSLAAALRPRRFAPARDRLATFTRMHLAGLRSRRNLLVATNRPDTLSSDRS